MSSIRHIVVTLGVLASSLAIVTAPAQKALGGQPSTPVTVVNPGTAPALTSNIDNPGRIAYQSVVNGQQSGTSCAGSTSCTFSFMEVPQGRRLVVQHVSGALNFDGVPVAVGVSLSSLAAQNRLNAAPLAFSAFFAPAAGNGSWFDQKVLVYFDAGSTPVVTVVSLAAGSASGSGAGKPPPAFTGDTQPITLTGYLVHCKSSPCPAIAPPATP